MAVPAGPSGDVFECPDLGGLLGVELADRGGQCGGGLVAAGGGVGGAGGELLAWQLGATWGEDALAEELAGHGVEQGFRGLHRTRITGAAAWWRGLRGSAIRRSVIVGTPSLRTVRQVKMSSTACLRAGSITRRVLVRPWLALSGLGCGCLSAAYPC
jgi:hypothetical protein